MNLLEAHQKLKALAPLFFTREAATVLGISTNYAAVVLTRLAKQNTIIRLTRGRWA